MTRTIPNASYHAKDTPCARDYVVKVATAKAEEHEADYETHCKAGHYRLAALSLTHADQFRKIAEASFEALEPKQ